MDNHAKLQFGDLEPVGPGTPAGRYLRLFWQPVIRARDLKRKQARPIEIMSERFTVYRGEDGIPRVTAFRCPHRGTQLSIGWVEGDSIRCRYHGWRFDGAGACVEQPNEEKGGTSRVRLQTYPTREYLGLIFAYLGEGEPPEFPRYPDFDRPGVIVADPPEVLPCSFWNKLDNDMGHIPWVHRATAIRKKRPDYLVPRTETVEETDYGYLSIRAAEHETPTFQDEAYFYMPNARQFWTPTRAKGFERRNLGDTKMTWTVPINDQKFAAFDITHTPLEGDEARAYEEARYSQMESEAEVRWDLGDEVLAGNMTLEELPDSMGAYTSFAIEDYATQVGQGPIEGRGKEHLGKVDAKPILLRRMWIREVSAMIDGRPMKKWQVPATRFVPDEIPDLGLAPTE